MLGDSEIAPDKLTTLENHLTREEVVEAAKSGEGIGQRLSHTTGINTMYAAVAVKAGPIAFVRVALPLTKVDERVAGVRRLALVGLGAAFLAAAFSDGRDIGPDQPAHPRRGRRPPSATRQETSRSRPGISATTASASSPPCSTTPRGRLARS